MMIPAMRAFDTHKYIKELTKSGFKEGQAEIIIKSILESRDYDFSKLSTKEQVAAVEKDIALMREGMSKFATKEQMAAQINASENNMLKWMIGLFLTTWSMMAGIAFKLFSH